MAFNKRTWKGRQGTGLNKFSIDGATPVTVINQPDSVTEQGDALSAGNLNDLEDRIYTAFEDEATARANADSNLKDALSATNKRVENLEEKAGDYTEVQAKSVYSVPTGKAKNMVLVGVEGRTRVDNQLIQNPNFESVSKWNVTNGSYTVSDNVATVTANSSNTFYISQSFSLISGHVYLFCCDVKASNSTMQLRISNAYGGNDVFASKNTNWQTLTTLWTGTYTGSLVYPNIYANDNVNGDSFQVRNVILRDLTVYFNNSIPTDADTIAEIQTNYPWLLNPSDYGTSMVKTRYEGFVSKSKNLANEDNFLNVTGVTKTGDYINLTDVYSASSYMNQNNIVSSFKPNTQYTISWKGKNGTATDVAFKARYTDGTNSGTLAKINSTTEMSANGTTASGKTVSFLYFDYGTNGTFSFKELQIEEGTTATSYSPYGTIATVSLPTPIELGSAGSVAEEAYLNEDGQAWKTNPISATPLDLSTLSWTLDTNRWYAPAPANMKIPASNNDIANIICAKFVARSVNDMYVNGGTGIGIASNNRIYCHNGDTANSPTGTLDYELATPDPDTPLTVLTDNLIPTEGGGTLEATKTYPIDDSFTVGYLTL